MQNLFVLLVDNMRPRLDRQLGAELVECDSVRELFKLHI